METAFTRLAGIRCPIIQAPMAGVSTPAMAAAVSNAGGLGSLGVGAAGADGARAMIRETRIATDGPFHINLFCHRPAVADAEREAAWLRRLAPLFAGYGAAPPRALQEIYTSFLVDDAMQAVLLEERPAVVSFHFGLPQPERIAALKAAGIVLMSSATSLAEGRAGQAAGMDAVIAQGWEAGGHRGVFDLALPDERLACLELTRMLARELEVPVVAAGGIMTGGDIADALTAGGAAAQLGTAFVGSPESAADDGYRAALLGAAAAQTTMTSAISGRPARCLANRFTSWAETAEAVEVPDYPIAYDAGKALNAAAKAGGEFGYGAQWAGQGAPLARSLAAGDMLVVLEAELREALGGA